MHQSAFGLVCILQMACSVLGAPVADGGTRNIFLYQFQIGNTLGSISSALSPTSGASLISSTSSSPTPVFSSFATQTFTMDAQTGSYTFGYDTGLGDHQSYRVETRSPSGTVTGRYGYVDPNGVLRIVDYVADHRGFRPVLTNRYPTAPSVATVIGPIPSSIITDETRLKTQKVNSSPSSKELALTPTNEQQPLISRTSDLSDVSSDHHSSTNSDSSN